MEVIGTSEFNDLEGCPNTSVNIMCVCVYKITVTMERLFNFFLSVEIV